MENKYGYIYVLSNPSLPNKYKIGVTTRSINSRLKELNNTSIPTPFKCEFYLYVKYPFRVEKQIHNYFSKYRINKNREFFDVNLDVIIKKIRNECLDDNKHAIKTFLFKMILWISAIILPLYGKWEISILIFAIIFFLGKKIRFLF